MSQSKTPTLSLSEGVSMMGDGDVQPESGKKTEVWQED